MDQLKDMLHTLLITHKPPGDSSTYLQLLQTCILKNAFSQGKKIHSFVAQTRFAFAASTTFQNKLINMYDKCGSLVYARKVFEHMKVRNVVSWNTIIAAYRRHECPQKAVALFHQMQRIGFQPDQFTFASVLPACAKMGALEQGYAQNGFVEKALETFKQMQSAGVKSDSTTFASILPACAKMGALEQGMDVHQSIMEEGLFSDVVVASALADMYAKCGRIDKAGELFNKMPQKNLVSWNAMIAGYAQNGFVEKALETFKQMQMAGVKPNSTTFASILPACARMGALEQGIDIHQSIMEGGFSSDVAVASALIDMYGKCGSIDKARETFDRMSQRDVVSWNAMIAGYAQNGFSKDALKIFELMKPSGIYPNIVSFACVLFACSHAGLVDEGCTYFNRMYTAYCITHTVDHYVCMVDLLSRAGYLDDTLNFIIKMPLKPVVIVWMCFLAACRLHMNIGLGVFTAMLLFDLDPKNAATYVLLSNIYAEVGMWGEVRMVRRLMTDGGIKKIPGCSWIEGHKTVHAFCAGDRSHPQTREIYAKLEKLAWEMKAAGYSSYSTQSLNDVEQEEKELFLCHHSEKLAIAFGLLNTPSGTTIRVVKNLRVCADCHTATKFISKIVGREIVVRDWNRFHHFKQGQCSCGDYW
ncbi:pentatricopeptide repeat-containing protein At3g12770 [Cryptomeria japonica]|uniref:pentatricopeptide repeat-containing protein At3g12770 n=1 Tax=Cryptomeria japonica TaxID=3369 RepID=UPI0027DA45E7|nr:pentatricopeptide repeat-containing protein At3g12770 [Cryptomeria japonica]